MLEVIELSNKEKWDETVTSFKEYDVYYLNGYSKGFYLHNDGIPLLFYYQNEGIRAINVVMKRDLGQFDKFKGLIPENTYFDLSTPYGYGGWLIEGDGNHQQLMDEYSTWCKENNIVSEIIRFHPVIDNANKVRDIYDVLDLGKTIAMDLSSEDVIWSNMTTQARGKIKKAKRLGVTVDHKIDIDTFEEFKKIYNVTMNKDNATNYYYFNDDFYRSILEDLDGKADIFYALYEGKMIAATIILKVNGYLTYHFSGVLTEYRGMQGTNLMLFETALWGAQNGYKTFHLGGGVGSKEDDLFIFKKSFNRYKDYQYSLGRKIFNQELYDKFVNLRTDITDEGYFPKYRG